MITVKSSNKKKWQKITINITLCKLKPSMYYVANIFVIGQHSFIKNMITRTSQTNLAFLIVAKSIGEF